MGSAHEGLGEDLQNLLIPTHILKPECGQSLMPSTELSTHVVLEGGELRTRTQMDVLER